MAIVNSVITDDSSPTTVLTVPAGKNYAITTSIVCNTYTPNPDDIEEGKAYFDMYLIPNGSTDVLPYESQVIKDLYLRAGETFTFDSEKLVLSEGDKIVFVSYSLPSGGDLSATVSYLEI